MGLIVAHCHRCSLLKIPIFIQLLLDVIDGWMDGHRFEQCLYIIRHYALVWLYMDAMYLLYKVLGILDLVW